MERVVAIVNPQSAHGRTGKRWPQLRRHVEAVLGPIDCVATSGPGHATECVREALRGGADRVISVGGDGTHHEVVNGFFDEDGPVRPEAVLSVLPQGTGNDLARSLGIPKGTANLAYLAEGPTLAADVGRAQRPSGAGMETTYFLNTCHVGMGGAVCERVNRKTKVWGGFITYFRATLATLLTYRDTPMRIEIDGEAIEQPVKDLILANGRYDGGGMHVAPSARLDSGRFEGFLIGPVALHDALVSLPTLYRGKLHTRPDIIRTFTARHVSLECTAPPPVAVDGEMTGFFPATIDLLPGVLRLTAHA